MNGGSGTTTVTAFVSSSFVNGDVPRKSIRSDDNLNDSDPYKEEHINESETDLQTATTSAIVSVAGEIKPSNGASSVPLLLPSSDDSNKNITSIKLGETISFAELGPIILNTDGTTRRIDNWNTLTKKEQETTWRRIQKRNAERREQLLLLQRQQEMEKKTDLQIVPTPDD